MSQMKKYFAIMAVGPLALIIVLLYQNCGQMKGRSIQSSQDLISQRLLNDINSQAQDLLNQMTLEEKVSQLIHESPKVERLGITPYNWWNEALHGAMNIGWPEVTVFPQAINMASSFDPQLVKRIGDATSDEQRYQYHLIDGNRMNENVVGMIFKGLNVFSPNINIARDPRWGRNGETYGEDPFLTSEIAVQYINGLQGDDPVYFKTVATLKHYAAHSGPESRRHTFEPAPSAHDLFDTYMPAFKAGSQRARAYSAMCAYSRFYDTHACQSPQLLTTYLRDRFGFNGFVVTDCAALEAIAQGPGGAGGPFGPGDGHDLPSVAVNALAAGVQLECKGSPVTAMATLVSAINNEANPTRKQEMINLVDQAVLKLLVARFRMGNLGSGNPYNNRTYQANTPANRQLALEAARKSIVLLKNYNNVLPLQKTMKVALIGPGAHDWRQAPITGPEENLQHPRWNIMYGGRYSGHQPNYVTPKMGIEEKIGASKVIFAKGFEFYGDANNPSPNFSEAMAAAAQADAIVFFGGLDEQLEGEGIDRTTIMLPQVQDNLISQIRTQYPNKPFVLVLFNGGVVVSRQFGNVNGILEAWYPGEEGGHALADILFGDVNPSAKMPMTVYSGDSQLPAYDNYSMTAGPGRTYRYLTSNPAFEFGFGLSYSRFEFSNLQIPNQIVRGQSVTVTATVKNMGSRAGDEVAQIYLAPKPAMSLGPKKKLTAFARITLNAGEQKSVTFTLPADAWGRINQNGDLDYPEATYTVSVGGRQPSAEAIALRNVVTRDVSFVHNATPTPPPTVPPTPPATPTPTPTQVPTPSPTPTVGPSPSPSPWAGCQSNQTTLCLQQVDGKMQFSVRVKFKDTTGAFVDAKAIKELSTNNFGHFWFYSQNNPELMIKILNAGCLNSHKRWWIFWGPMTQTEHRITIIDHKNGRQKEYSSLEQAAGMSDLENFVGGTNAGTCSANAQTLCLTNNRFKVSAKYNGEAMSTTKTSGTDVGGHFWKYTNNPEVVLKVLDGQAFGGKSWVFIGGLTDQNIEVQVIDTYDGNKTKSYSNGGALKGGNDNTYFYDLQQCP